MCVCVCKIIKRITFLFLYVLLNVTSLAFTLEDVTHHESKNDFLTFFTEYCNTKWENFEKGNTKISNS